MKKVFLLLSIVLGCLTGSLSGQNVNELTAHGKKAFLEIKFSKEAIPDAYEQTKRFLTGNEWNQWIIVDNPDDRDFTVRLTFEKKGMNVMSFRSMGGRVRVVAEILDRADQTVWKSKKHQGNATVYTGFDAMTDALNKVVRRALGEELRANN